MASFACLSYLLYVVCFMFYDYLTSNRIAGIQGKVKLKQLLSFSGISFLASKNQATTKLTTKNYFKDYS